MPRIILATMGAYPIITLLEILENLMTFRLALHWLLLPSRDFRPLGINLLVMSTFQIRHSYSMTLPFLREKGVQGVLGFP